MKTKELRDLSIDDLTTRMAELQKDLMKMNAEIAVSNPKNPGKVRQVKRSIARIRTLINEKQTKGGTSKA